MSFVDKFKDYTSSNKRVIDIQEGFTIEKRNDGIHIKYQPSGGIEKYEIDTVR